MNHLLRLTFLTTLYAAVSFVPNSSLAQGPVFGVKGGVTLSNLYSGEVDNRKGRVGFNLGLLGRTDPAEPMGLQFELLYITKGETFTYQGLLIDQESTLNLGYLDLPVMTSVRLLPGVEFQLGIYGGLLLSSNVSTSGDLGNGSETLEKSNFHTFDYGFAGGVAVNAGDVQIGARYNHGLSKLAGTGSAEAILGDAKNTYAQFYLAYCFPGAQ